MTGVEVKAKGLEQEVTELVDRLLNTVRETVYLEEIRRMWEEGSS